jgi:pyruvate ferredoxin oxidoreductase gamma subunit
MLGGFAALTGVVGLDAVLAAIDERFTGKVAAGNIAAAQKAFEFVTNELAKEKADA